MSPPERLVQNAVNSFCERLCMDINGPEQTRRQLLTDEGEHTELPYSIVRRLLAGRQDVLGQENIRQPGERYVKETLIWPILNALGYEYRIEVYLGTTDNLCDFRPVNTTHAVIGECKSPNKYQHAVTDLSNYKKIPEVNAEYGIATDGFNWQLLSLSSIGRNEVLAEFDIRSMIAADMEFRGCRNAHNATRRVTQKASVNIHSEHVGNTDSTRIAEAFVEEFHIDNVNETLTEHTNRRGTD